MKSVNWPKVFRFVLLAYLFNWVGTYSYFWLGGTVDSTAFTFVALASMGTPALAAWVVQKLIHGEPIAELGIRFKINRWYLPAIVIPLLIASLSVVTSVLIPGTELTGGLPAIVGQMEAKNMPDAQIESVEQVLSSFGAFLPVLLAGASMASAAVLGSTVNAIPALGEEMGWRGLLHKEFEPLGFWTSNLIVGVIWGLWHFPLIIHGYNYPDHPVAGVFMMTLLTVLLSPLFSYIRIKSDTVIAAAVIHGVFNAIAGLPLLFVIGGSDLTVGVTGFASILALVFINLGLYLYKQYKS